MYTLNCKGKIICIDKPLIMGIINATSDSFFEGHLFKSNNELLDLVKKMIDEGVDIIDIGGQSTKPNSQRISVDEELKRVLPVIELFIKNYPEIIISIDTYNNKIAEAAVNAGAKIVNDISGGNMDTEMINAVAKLNVPYICMHMEGTPESMQEKPVYKDIVTELLDFFIAKIDECKKAGIVDIIIDPGFGFGKTIENNFTLLKNLNALSILQKPILAGISRKSTIYKTLQSTAQEALNGTTVLNTIALLNGASILRVHDVKEAKEAAILISAYKNAP